MNRNSRNQSNLFHLGEIRASANQPANTILKGYWCIISVSPTTTYIFSLNMTIVSHLQLINPSVLGVRLNEALYERSEQEGSQQQPSTDGPSGWLSIHLQTRLRAYGETFWQNFIWGASGNYSSTLSQPSRRHKAEDAVEDIEQNVTNYVNVKAR